MSTSILLIGLMNGISRAVGTLIAEQLTTSIENALNAITLSTQKKALEFLIIQFDQEIYKVLIQLRV